MTEKLMGLLLCNTKYSKTAACTYDALHYIAKHFGFTTEIKTRNDNPLLPKAPGSHRKGCKDINYLYLPEETIHAFIDMINNGQFDDAVESYNASIRGHGCGEVYTTLAKTALSKYNES